MKKHRGFNRTLLNVLGLLTIGLLAGCGGGSDGGGGTSAPGIVSVSLTDAPACGYEQVNVTVSKVRIHQSDSANDNGPGWSEIVLNPARTINLLSLNDPTQPNLALESLGETTLAAGHYTQLRLVLVDNNGNNANANWVILEGADPNNTQNRIPLETPSAIKSGIKLINQFTVDSGQRVDLLLDFDACHSIVKTGSGKYILKPVIKVIPTVLNGIEGFLDAGLFTNANAHNVIVSAQVNGEIVRATVPNSNPAPNPIQGKFFLARLTPGVSYDVVVTADGYSTTVISGVPIPTSTTVQTVSTSSTRTPLNAIALVPPTHTVAGTVTFAVAPPLPADDESVFMVARQQLHNGPLVTVKSQVASVLNTPAPDDYGYTFTLPVDSPWLASGSGSLPLPSSAFTKQPVPPSADSVAGKYAVQASASGYVTQSANVDISGGDKQQDFVLPQTP